MTTGNYMTISEDQTSTLLSRDYKDPQCVSYGINGDKAGTLDANYYRGCGEREVVAQTDGQQHYIVRRLTPLECERLQGFPDGWTDIGKWIDEKDKERECTDGARYKALGNSIAIPPWFYVLQRLSLACGADKTMASLFDGIGGFPLIWEGLHGEGSCIWASEIEGFPIAVTKDHFPEEVEQMGYVITIEPQIRAKQNVTILNPREDLREIIDNDMGSEVADLYDEIIYELEEDDYGDDYEAIADSLRNFLVDCMNELQEIVMQKRLNRDKLLNLYKKMNREL